MRTAYLVLYLALFLADDLDGNLLRCTEDVSRVA